MSDMKASVTETKSGLHVEGYEKIEYDFHFLDGVFNVNNDQLAARYKPWGRCLAVMDLNIQDVYGEQMQAYFNHHGLDLKVHTTMIGEKAKSIETFLSLVDSMNEFGIYRKVCGCNKYFSEQACLFDVGAYACSWGRTCDGRRWVKKPLHCSTI